MVRIALNGDEKRHADLKSLGEYQPSISSDGFFYNMANMPAIHQVRILEKKKAKGRKVVDKAESLTLPDLEEGTTDIKMPNFKLEIAPNTWVHCVSKAYSKKRLDGTFALGFNDAIAIYTKTEDDVLTGVSTIKPFTFFRLSPIAVITILARHPHLWQKYGSPRSLLWRMEQKLKAFEVKYRTVCNTRQDKAMLAKLRGGNGKKGAGKKVEPSNNTETAAN